jgi:aspartate-semialdehyde dehydrogenase
VSGRAVLRLGVVGATGALGGELVGLLEERRFPVGELLPIATEDSRGAAVELRGEAWNVVGPDAPLRGLDLLFLCAPPTVSLELARRALHAEVPCLDLSGALAGMPEVPIVVAALGAGVEQLRAPIVAAPASPALAWSLALAPLASAAGLERVVGTALVTASAGGRRGIESLSQESIALFNQQDAPEPEVFGRPVAFDCLPDLGDLDEQGDSPLERALARDLRALIDPDLRVAVTAVRVPTFAGDGATLAVETARPLAVDAARAALEKAPGVQLWDEEAAGPTTRASAGQDDVLVGRLRRDPSVERGLLLWIAADALRLAARNGIQLAEAWLAARL